MEKIKFNIPIGLIGAACYVAAFFGGYVAVILICGYVLLCEEDVWLRKTAMQAFALLAVFSLIIGVVNLLPDFLNVINSMILAFDSDASFTYDQVTRIVRFIVNVINFVEKVMFLLFAFLAAKKASPVLGMIDSLMHKAQYGAAPKFQQPVQAPYQAPYQAPGASVNPGTRFCTNCGTPVPEDSGFCPQCGAKMN